MGPHPHRSRSATRFARAALGLKALLLVLAGCGGVKLHDLVTRPPLPEGSCVVVGFLGGRSRWDDESQGVRRLALTLRDPGNRIFVETFENQKREVAAEFVLGLLQQGVPPPRLVVYGMSFGGAAVVKFARMLETRSIPIELTVQLDSVGRDDDLVPANVRFALNLYQSDGWFIRGEEPIRAEAPESTLVLGNRRFHYDRPPGSEIDISDVPWWKLAFRIPHARMDRDERVWTLVREAIQTACRGDTMNRLEQ